MALKGCCGFDTYAIGDEMDEFQSDSSSPNSSIVAGAGRCSSSAYRNTAANGGGPLIGVTTTSPGGYVGVAYSPESFGTVATYEVQAADGGVILFFRCVADGSVEVWTGPNTTLGVKLGATAAGLLSTGHYDHLGFEWWIANTASGLVRIWVNDVLELEVLTPTFQDTQQWRAFLWQPKGYIDDLYWGDASGSAPDNAFMGDCRVEEQLALTDAVGGGGVKEWTPSAGTDHGALVNENPPDDGTTYLEGDTVGEQETFLFPSITPASGTIYGVQLMPNLVKTVAGGRQVASVVKSGGSDALGTATGVAQTTYKYYPGVFALNPVTGVAWTVATVNAMQGGVEITA